ncbi:MAG TPA: 6,7-dimethyl-8-ribityllumazine synthase [Candidatus Limnocylindria bacterium]|nr:6,7-dimethyl-8-ribityllumazine synthase [Candidatus Limnocylindria bacterium]
MLKEIKVTGVKATGGHFAIVASKYNARYVDAMVRAATAILKKAKAQEIQVIRVPGAFEIPLVAAKVAGGSPSPSAIICLGVIIRGATTHAQSIGDVVSYALGTIALQSQIPVIHEVLLLENEQQARERCLSKTHNRGAEAALTAIEMSSLLARL